MALYDLRMVEHLKLVSLYIFLFSPYLLLLFSFNNLFIFGFSVIWLISLLLIVYLLPGFIPRFDYLNQLKERIVSIIRLQNENFMELTPFEMNELLSIQSRKAMEYRYRIFGASQTSKSKDEGKKDPYLLANYLISPEVIYINTRGDLRNLAISALFDLGSGNLKNHNKILTLAENLYNGAETELKFNDKTNFRSLLVKVKGIYNKAKDDIDLIMKNLDSLK